MQSFDFLKTGDTFDERYEVVSILGQGATGGVVRVIDLQTQEARALKILYPHLIRDQSSIERFQNEVRVLRRISHPNVLRVYNFHVSDTGYHYISMEYFEGTSLRGLIAKKGALAEPDAIPVLRDIALGMSAAHAEGVIHRDLKPDNILISDDLEVKIVDFGLARALDDDSHLTATGVGVGTPYYMSPEQLLGEQATVGSDIYSFGIVGFQIITGQVPFTGDSLVELARQHIEVEFPYGRLESSGCSKWLVHLLGSCAEKEPRYRSNSFDYICTLLEYKTGQRGWWSLGVADHMRWLAERWYQMLRAVYKQRTLPYVTLFLVLVGVIQTANSWGVMNLQATRWVFLIEKKLSIPVPLVDYLFVKYDRTVEQINDCIRGGDYLCVDVLAETLDTVDVVDRNGDYPLLMATRFGLRDNAYKLLYHGADPNFIEPATGRSPLFYAVRGGSFLTVRDLLRARARIDLLDYKGRSVFTVLFEEFENYVTDPPDIFAGSRFEVDDYRLARKELGERLADRKKTMLEILFIELLRYPGSLTVRDREGRSARDFVEALRKQDPELSQYLIKVIEKAARNELHPVWSFVEDKQ